MRHICVGLVLAAATVGCGDDGAGQETPGGSSGSDGGSLEAGQGGNAGNGGHAGTGGHTGGNPGDGGPGGQVNDAAPDSAAACGETLISGPCQCGASIVSQGYCCGGIAQIAPCSDYGGGGSSYYVDPNGHDDTGDGSQSNPWKTLAHACDQAKASGDIIHLNAGTFPETTQCELAVGVSIEGTGDTSIVTSNIATEWVPTIQLRSSDEGTVGNQHLSNFKMDGLLTADSPVAVVGRSQVSIHDMTFVDFGREGPSFRGRVAGDGIPTIFATGNMFYSNHMSNCASDYYVTEGSTTYHFANGGLGRRHRVEQHHQRVRHHARQHQHHQQRVRRH